MCQGLNMHLIYVLVGYLSRTLGVLSRIINFMIRTWNILLNKLNEIDFSDVSSFDAITRQLPEGFYSTFRTYVV